jgi:hypothetical protein
MSDELKFAVNAIATPTVVALAAAAILHRVLPEKLGQRIGLAVGLAAGFCAACWLMGEWPLAPERPRQWLPWLALAGAFVGWTFGPSTLPDGRTGGPSYVAWLAGAGLAIVSAWLLVPAWESLWPPRVIAIPLVAAYLLAVMALLAALPDRLLGRLFVSLLALAAVMLALLIAIGVGFTMAEVAAAAAAGLGGCAVAAVLPLPKPPDVESARAVRSRGLVPVFAVLAVGFAYVGMIDPIEPVPIILLAPSAPLMLWLFAAGPLAKLRGWKAAALQIAAVLLPLAVALAVVVAS